MRTLGTDTPIAERATYIPEWGNHHEGLELQQRVTNKDGKDLGFTIADMLPERRWAVGAGGKVLEQDMFDRLYERWISNTCAPNGQIVAVAAVNKYFTASLESIPIVANFVDATLDDDGKIIPLTFDKYKPAVKRDKTVLYNHQGDPVAAAEAKSDRSKIAQLGQLMELRPHLPPGVFDEKLSALVATSITAAGEPEVVEEAPPMPAGFDAVAGETVYVSAPCGRQIPERELANHQSFCKACQDV